MAKITDLSSNVWIGEPTEEDMSTLLLFISTVNNATPSTVTKKKSNPYIFEQKMK